MAFFFLVCPDADLLLETARSLVPNDSPLQSFWAETPLPERYWQALTVLPFGVPGCGVLLRHAELALAEDWERLDRLLRRGRAGIVPLFALEGEWDKKRPHLPKAVTGSKCFAAAKKRQWIWESPGLDARAALAVAEQELQRSGKTLSPEARRLLEKRLPGRLAAIRTEMAKVALAAGDSPQVTPQHLEVLVGEDHWDVFALIQAALTPAKRLALWRQLRHDPQMASGDSVFLVLALLRREARILWSLARGETPADKVPAWALNAKQGLAKCLGPASIAHIFSLLAEAETAIKSGRSSPAQALEWLLHHISQLQP